MDIIKLHQPKKKSLLEHVFGKVDREEEDEFLDFYEIFYTAHQKACEIADDIPHKEFGNIYFVIDYLYDTESDLGEWCKENWEFLKADCELSVCLPDTYGVDLLIRRYKNNKTAQLKYARMFLDHCRAEGIDNMSFTHFIEE